MNIFFNKKDASPFFAPFALKTVIESICCFYHDIINYIVKLSLLENMKRVFISILYFFFLYKLLLS